MSLTCLISFQENLGFIFTNLTTPLQLMLHHVGVKPRPTLFLDFLAPKLARSRAASSSSRRSQEEGHSRYDTESARPGALQPTEQDEQFKNALDSASIRIRDESSARDARRARYNTKKLAAIPSQPIMQHELFKNISERLQTLHSGSSLSLPDEKVGTFNETVGNLRQALKDGDISLASKNWHSMKQKNLLSFLGPSHIEGYSRLISNLHPQNNPTTKWSNKQLDAAERMALGAATLGSATAALTTCMQYRIVQNEPDEAIKLYRKFSKSLAEEEIGPLTQGEGVKDEDANSLLSLPDQPMRYSPGRAAVLLMVIVAHAMKNSFADALHDYLQTTVRIPEATLLGRLQPFAHDRSLQQRTALFAKRLEVARSIANSATLTQHINNLSRNHAIDGVEKLYNAVLDGFSGPYAYLTTDANAVCHNTPILINEASWGCFITAFVRCRKNKLAEKAWDDMVSHGIAPSVVAWTALILGYEDLGLVAETVQAWDAMLSVGVKPDAYAYRSFCSVLCKGEEPDEALKHLQEYEGRIADGSLPSDNSIRVYNTILHGLLVNSREPDATKLLQKLQQGQPKPDLVTYNTFLRYYGRRADFKALGSTLQRLASDGLVGDAFTFTTILSALLKAGREDAEDLTFKLMQKQNIIPNVGFYTAIIDYQVRQQDPKHLQSALNILKRMEEDSAVKANQVPYTSLLAGIYRVHWLDRKVADECTKYIQGRMKAQQIRPNRVTYHILIAAALENRQSEGLQNALSLYRDMVRRRIGMTNDTWAVILRGLVDRKEWALAREVVEDMYRMGDVEPVGATAKFVSRIRQQTAKRMQLGPDGYI